jgi:hypothetical protein
LLGVVGDYSKIIVTRSRRNVPSVLLTP